MINLILIILGISILFIILGVAKPKNSIIAQSSRKEAKENLAKKLEKAGIIDITADILIFIMFTLAFAVALIVFIIFLNPIYSLIAACLVYPITLIYLNIEARKFNDKILNRMVSFIRKIESQIRTNTSTSNAFLHAVKDDKLLFHVLKQDVKSLELNQPFPEVLRGTVTKIPLRPWINFIKTLEIYEESGGKVTDILSKNVKRINTQILLKQKLMAELSLYKTQQIVLIIFAILTPLALFLLGGDIFGSIISSPGTIIALVIAILIDALALFITDRAIKDVERRLNI